MPLYIRDDDVAELARQAKEATGAKTVTEAVRSALEKALADARTAKLSRAEGIRRAIARADAMGPSNHDFDMKAFMDELSGE